MGVVVEKAGILTTIQDQGRFGYQQFGVSPAGPMDVEAFYLANILAGNDRGESALEITFQGPVLRFEEANVIAVTGGDLKPRLNGKPLPMYQAVAVRANDELAFGSMCGNGCRAYLAFAGGLDVPVVMGSKATLLRNQIGGLEGRKLKAGDVLRFSNPQKTLKHMDSRRLLGRIYPRDEITLRVVTGPQDSAFSEEEINRFFWYSGKITNEFDRMGCRIQREIPVRHKTDGNIITDGIAFGSIQVPTDGQPIIMLADRQSTGGYTKIGTVISVDLPVLAQSLPGYQVRFVRVGIELAQTLYMRRLDKLNKIENYLNS